jgi:hypothetical protein
VQICAGLGAGQVTSSKLNPTPPVERACPSFRPCDRLPLPPRLGQTLATMLGVLRSAARQAKPALQGVRRMSSNIDFATEAKEAGKWKVGAPGLGSSFRHRSGLAPLRICAGVRVTLRMAPEGLEQRAGRQPCLHLGKRSHCQAWFLCRWSLMQPSL